MATAPPQSLALSSLTVTIMSVWPGALQGPGVATSPGDAKPHDGPRPPWTGGYQSFTPSTPGFPGYEAENRVLPPEVAMAGLRPADPGSIAYNAEERTFDCEASLTDTQVGAPRPPRSR